MGVMGARKVDVARGAAKGKGTGPAKPGGRGSAQLELVAMPPAAKKGARAAPLAAPAKGPKPGKAVPPPRKGAPARAQPELLPEPTPEAPPERGPKRRATAEQMASKQREISISEFFTKNRHPSASTTPPRRSSRRSRRRSTTRSTPARRPASSPRSRSRSATSR
jgi:DNA topoisomerase-6 subunit B